MIRAFNLSKNLTRSCGLIAAICLAAPTAHGDTILKANNTNDLNLGTSWTGGTAPGFSDIAQWDSSVAAANSVQLGADTSWLGLVILNPGGDVTINGPQTLTLGANGIDMSAATRNLTINSKLSLAGTLTKTGTTTLTLSGANTYTGGTTVTQGTLQGIDTAAYTGTATTTASNPFGSGKVTLSGGTLAYRIGTGTDTAAQILTLGNDMEVTSSSTLDYTRSGGTTANKTLAFGNLTLGTSTLTTIGANGYVASFSSVTLTGNATVGGSAQGALTLGAISESGGARTLTLSKSSGGVGTNFTLTSANTYTGGTFLSNVTVTLQDKAAFGTGTVSVSGGTVTVRAFNSLTGAEKIMNTFANTGGNFVVGGSNNIELAGTITTNGGRTTRITNSAKTIFSGLNNSSGNLDVSTPTGTLELAADLGLNGGTVLINGTGGTIDATNGAKLKINSTAGRIETSGELTINAEIADGTQKNIIINGGTVKMTGANTYTGTTAINAGTLLANNTSGSATGTGSVSTLVNSGATLGGSGSISGGSAGSITINSGTQLRIGDTHGVVGGAGAQDFQVGQNGNVAITLAGTLQFDLFANEDGITGAEADRLIIRTSANTIQLGGTIVVADASGTSGWTSGTWQLIDWTNLGTELTRSGSFSFDFTGAPSLAEGYSWYTDDFLINGTISVVPEPSRVILMLLGLAAFYARRRR